MKQQTFWKYIWIVLIISFALAILIHFEKFASFFDIPNGFQRGGYKAHSISETISDVLVSSAVAFITFIINYFIIKPFDSSKKIDYKKITSSIVITIISITILSDFLFNISKNGIPFGNFQNPMFLYFFRDLLISAVVLVSVYFLKVINDRQTIKIENEKLKTENLLSQFEMLKKQVSPHFFFNSLTSLKELISQEPHKAEEYINHLSLVMRYTLQNNESKTQSLKDELFVAESYLFLAKIRFENNLRINKNIDPRFELHLMPALALQTLIENAIKHNEISKRHPLTINIETTQKQSLKVRNNLQERITHEQSTGTGLINLSRQYKFLSGKDIVISKLNNEFSIELPLLKPD